MTDGNLELVEVLVWYATVLPSVRAILVHDERRLRGAQAARAWPSVSRDAALFAIFNVGLLFVFVVPIHFWRTRRTVLGTAMGLVWVLALAALVIAAQIAVAAAIELLRL